ncbi:hypothetical protein AN477_15815 [Alicyclobacillus ferrooxydans]|uniref:Uncharacterized protein n=1 Tax=Alicyclobacillus ferrooxydans TaxID=471514 RepID=A0A0P9CBJ8_9BACL|nr:hypothetical protein AN477_15815 [Alicyclobacillus ferrooxydans]
MRECQDVTIAGFGADGQVSQRLLMYVKQPRTAIMVSILQAYPLGYVDLREYFSLVRTNSEDALEITNRTSFVT